MGKGFSASTIKSWFQYRCERKVRYELSSDVELAAIPIVKDVREKPWAILGNQFEERVVRRLSHESSVLKPSFGDDALSEVLTGAFLRGKRPEAYAAQMNLRPSGPASFLEGTGLYLNRNLADLIRRSPSATYPGRTELTIIDVKATRRATAFHKTQVAFYARVLQALLQEMKVSDTSISRTGEIWRIKDDGSASSDEWQVEAFALDPYIRLVDDFCANHLPEIAAKQVGVGVDRTFFHVYFKCEQCSFLEHCRSAIDDHNSPSTRDVSAVAGLTHEAKRSLQRLGVTSVGNLATAKGLAQAPGISWSLSRRAGLLINRAASLASGSILRTEEQNTYLMPPRIDAALIISVDHDPVDDRIAALGYRRIDHGVIQNEVIKVARSGDTRDEIAAIVDVLAALIADLTAIDTHNEAVDGDDDRSVYAHILFYEPSEVLNLQTAIGRHLEDERIRTGLLHLVRLFPPDDLVPEPEFRGVHHLPATAMRTVIEQLWALPVTVAYDLRQVSQAVFGRDDPRAYKPTPQFERPFSSLLSIDIVRDLRENGEVRTTFDDVRNDVADRLSALQALTNWTLEQNRQATTKGKALLRLSKRPFRFQATFDPLNAVDLDVLLACELLENRAGMLDALINLARPAQRRRDSGKCFANLYFRDAQKKGGKVFIQFDVPIESQSAELNAGEFGLILTDDDPDNRLNPALWPAFTCRIRPPSNSSLAQPGNLRLEMPRTIFEGPLFQSVLQRNARNNWFVDKAFFDVNTDRAARFLSYLAAGENR
ncbi:hypothetical protein A6U86_27440 [Rhizobium sp. AC27/96]|uniref:hypothetical protein n=1 Tax=Rhizobium sp. AC27/96 TaxID=1841653 RepID=UPI000827BA92|nr:hypothetical protein [Rhizobium sp. AC27/96]OCJ08651.1 hypothetical protein A6U86_27440 [Rhizobium sp. AC27/96]